MKACSSCKIVLDFCEFYKSNTTKSGYQSSCKSCSKTRNKSDYMKNYREANKEQHELSNREYYKLHKQRLNNESRQYYIENKEHLREKGNQHYLENKVMYLLYSKSRKKHIDRATPLWLSDQDYSQIVQIYQERKRLTEETGNVYHVDHILPLRGKLVCGLHVPSNLQIILASENLKKGSAFNV